MKRLYTRAPALLALAMAPSVWTYAQPLLEVTDQRHDRITSNGIQRSASGHWLVNGFQNDEGGTGSHFFIRVLTTDGVETATLSYGSDFESTPNGMIFSISHFSCDLGFPETYLWSTTEEGNYLGTTTISGPLGVNSFRADHIADRTADRLALIATNLTAIVTLDSEVQSFWGTPIAGVRGGTWIGPSIVLLWNDTSLAKLDADDGSSEILSIGGTVRNVHFKNDSVFVLTADAIIVLDTDLLSLGTVQFTGYDPLVEVLEQGQARWIRTTTGVFQLDADLQAIGGFLFEPFANGTISGALLEDDRVVTVGETAQLERSTAFIRAYTLGGNTTEHDMDVEIGLSVDSVWRAWPTTSMHNGRITLQFTNHGSETVDSLFVNHQRGQSITCGIEGTSIQYTDLDLHPGETITRVIPSMFISSWWGPSSGTWIQEVCMIALSPNSLVDRNMDDNYSCTSVELGTEITTGISNITGVPATYLAPNPTIAQTTVRGLQVGTKGIVEIRDMLGRTVYQRTWLVAVDGTMQLDISDLLTGRYIMTILGSEGPVVLPLVKVD